MAGWYLANNRIGRKGRIALYIAGVAAVIASIFTVQYCISDIIGIRDYCYEALTLTAFLYGCVLFVLIKSLCGNRKTSHVVALLSDMSFGIYMIHILYYELLTQKLMPYEAFGLQSPFAYIVIAFAIVFALSLITVYAVSHVKYLKKIFYMK
ncbi:MAG: acyltransferase family protein [Hominilimicola sp.]